MPYRVTDEELFNKEMKNIVITDCKNWNEKHTSFNIHTTAKLAEDAVFPSMLGCLPIVNFN
jgi:hypothetical protein